MKASKPIEQISIKNFESTVKASKTIHDLSAIFTSDYEFKEKCIKKCVFWLVLGSRHWLFGQPSLTPYIPTPFK